MESTEVDKDKVIEDRCQRCGCETKGEMAWVDGQIWCHPCADEATAGSASCSTTDPCPVQMRLDREN